MAVCYYVCENCKKVSYDKFDKCPECGGEKIETIKTKATWGKD